jgi:hypothetical protein
MDNKIRTYMNKNEKQEQTIEGVNQRIKEALIRLNINVDVNDDSRFFESALKEICRSHFRLSQNLKKLLASLD